MKKYFNIASWLAGFALLLVLAAFSSKKEGQVKLKGTDIQVDYSNNLYFVNKEEVAEIVRAEYPYIDSLYRSDINIKLLEESIDNHPSIRKAEVYSALDGILRIRVNQKQPVIRIHNSQRDFYIDELGDTMALSPGFSAEVPLVTGVRSAESMQEVYEFFKALPQDEFYEDFFAGLDIGKDGSWILYPRPGRHKVMLGRPEGIAEKLGRLKTFYQSVIDRKNLDNIASLDLEYENQVVCIKH